MILTEEKTKRIAPHVCSACTSTVCMAQMGTMAATGTTMGAMGAAGAASSVPLLTLAFQAAGLGFLLAFPPAWYQIALIIILGVTIAASYLSYKFHKSVGPLGLTILSSFLIYGSIYVFVSELFYWISFVLLLLSTAWSYKVSR